MMSRKKENKGISRIDSGSTHGWFVRGYRNGKTHSKLFSDRKCGGKDEAYALAKAYRQELSDKLDCIPEEPRKRRIVSSDTRNKSGELGVTFVVKKGPKSQKYESYSVSWRPKPGVQKCTSFSIKKYGKEQAFKLAVEHRRKMMLEAHGDVFEQETAQENPDPVSEEIEYHPDQI
jgi:hypothetical protein